MKTIILTDSTSDIEKEEIKNLDINVLPLTVSFGDKSFVDGVTLTKREFYDMQKSSEEFPVTSQINPDTFLEFFNKCKENNDEVVYISISSKLSGTMQSAVIAKQMCGYDKIYIVDSFSASLGEYALIIKACQMRDEGKNAQQISEFLQTKIDKLKIFAAVDTLKYLIKGGRVSKTMGTIGGVLNLKPIISLKDGVIISAGKARGRKNAFEMILKEVSGADIDLSMPIIVTHSNSVETLTEFVEFLKENGVDYPYVQAEVGSVIGAHTGPDCVGILFFEK